MSGAALPYTLFRPDAPTGRAVYLIASPEDARAVWDALECERPLLVAVEAPDWNRDLSPWPAKRAFKGGDDFAGGADAFLRALVNSVVPRAESGLAAPVERRALAGVSLAGLFAVYALYQADCFDSFASVSGSLWYDGFVDWMRQRAPSAVAKRAYLSLGDRESAARSERLAAVERRTIEARELLTQQGLSAFFELNPGNHFADGTLRMKKAIEWLCGSEDA